MVSYTILVSYIKASFFWCHVLLTEAQCISSSQKDKTQTKDRREWRMNHSCLPPTFFPEQTSHTNHGEMEKQNSDGALTDR